jgi:hypothetical protein
MNAQEYLFWMCGIPVMAFAVPFLIYWLEQRKKNKGD